MKHRHPYHLITHVTILLFHLFLFLSPLTAQSLRFHPVFSDDMVLQREKPVAIFGFGKPGSEVSVEFKGLNQKTIIEPEGRWKVVLPEFSTSTEGALLKATSENESISCKNLLVGDVWFCGGQSNMHHTFNMYTMLKGNIPSLGNPLVRFYPVNHQISDKPLLEPVSPTVAGEPLSNRWYPSNPSTLGNCSPTAYFFAAKVSEELKVSLSALSFGLFR